MQPRAVKDCESLIRTCIFQTQDSPWQTRSVLCINEGVDGWINDGAL